MHGQLLDIQKIHQFDNRYRHLSYSSCSSTKTLCIAYAFVCNENGTVNVMWGACIMKHRKGSPPKRALRSTSLARIQKCPTGAVLSDKEFGQNLQSGKAFHRKKLFKKLVFNYGVRGKRIPKMSCVSVDCSGT